MLGILNYRRHPNPLAWILKREEMFSEMLGIFTCRRLLLVFIATLKKKAACFFKMFAYTYKIILCQITEDHNMITAA
jgi:hypothetical protein